MRSGQHVGTITIEPFTSIARAQGFGVLETSTCVFPVYQGGSFAALIMIPWMLAFPGLLLALVVIASLGPGLTNVMLAVGVSSVPLYARLVRASCLTIRELEYVQAARALGGLDRRIIVRHILPNVLGPLVVLSTLQVGSAILVGSALSYLGMGIQPPGASWGAMIRTSMQQWRYHPHLALMPGVVLFLAVLAANFIGDGLNDALNPHIQRK